MKIEQIYTGCLAEAAYYIESNGEAVVIDPLRETEPYIERARKDGATIKYILETHFHADFVSGHLDLARETGATIVYGPNAQPSYEAYIAKDGEELKVGKISIKVLHTPGHTLESTTYLLKDEKGVDHAIFTGDTLFLGDVGRPDLAIKQGELNVEDLAGLLFDSLRDKIMPLGDDVIVYPAHGAGSACGKKLSNETSGRLGDQKMLNYALRKDMTKAEFVEEVTSGLVAPPQYFPKNAMMNKLGYESIEEVRDRGIRPLNVRAFRAAWEEEHAVVLDTRSKESFAKGFIPGTIFIGLEGDLAIWVGTLIKDIKQPILFIADPGREKEVVNRLARVGYDHAIGYLEGGFASWEAADGEVDRLKELSPVALAEQFHEGMNILDVRKCSEFRTQHLSGAQSFPLGFINQNMADIDRQQSYYLHCKSGYRSTIAASILKARGFDQVVNIPGGFDAMSATALPLTRYEEQHSDL